MGLKKALGSILFIQPTRLLLIKINCMGFPGGTVVKNLPANAGDARDTGLIAGSGRSLGVGNGNPSDILTGRIPWTEEPGGLQSMGLQ